MTDQHSRRAGRQGGYTLVEVVIACSIGALLMAALTSVILTSVRAVSTASSRVVASGEIRSFEFFAHDDFASSSLPIACPWRPSTCLVLNGFQASNSSIPSVVPYRIIYSWDGSAFLDRQVGGGPPEHVATDVTSFSWYIDGVSPKQTCVIIVTVTVASYAESQTLRFYPQLQS